MAKQILTRIKDELKAMQQSRNQEYIQTEIKWDDKRSFSVECFRKGDPDEIKDADGNIIYDDLDSAGEVIEFDVYYAAKGIDIDACTLTGKLTNRDMQELKQFVSMYR